MLALVTLETWQVVAVLAFIATLFVLLLHARRWSVKCLVMVRVYYKDGTRKDFVTFPCCLEALYKTLAGNPRILTSCHAYSPDMSINPSVTKINLFRFRRYGWHHNRSLESNLELTQTLWDSKHALLVNILRDFGVEDGQPLPPRSLGIAANQRLDEIRMNSVLGNPSAAHVLTGAEVAYLERLDDCLHLAILKNWARDNRLNHFNGKLPGADELVMELFGTDEGAKRVLACINRDWKPETTPPPPPEPSI